MVRPRQGSAAGQVPCLKWLGNWRSMQRLIPDFVPLHRLPQGHLTGASWAAAGLNELRGGLTFLPMIRNPGSRSSPYLQVFRGSDLMNARVRRRKLDPSHGTLRLSPDDPSHFEGPPFWPN